MDLLRIKLNNLLVWVKLIELLEPFVHSTKDLKWINKNPKWSDRILIEFFN